MSRWWERWRRISPLNAVDYRAGERTFQLLTQAVGRAGRGEKPGMAVIQTYHPEHYSIQTAAEQDYGAFYEKEMDYRRLMGYPRRRSFWRSTEPGRMKRI